MRLWSMEYIAWKVRKAYTYGTAARHAHRQTFSRKGCAERGRPDADHRGISESGRSTWDPDSRTLRLEEAEEEPDLGRPWNDVTGVRLAVYVYVYGVRAQRASGRAPPYSVLAVRDVGRNPRKAVEIGCGWWPITGVGSIGRSSRTGAWREDGRYRALVRDLCGARLRAYQSDNDFDDHPWWIRRDTYVHVGNAPACLGAVTPVWWNSSFVDGFPGSS